MCTCILPGKAVPEMTYTVSGGTLSSTHSLMIRFVKHHTLQSDVLSLRLLWLVCCANFWYCM